MIGTGSPSSPTTRSPTIRPARSAGRPFPGRRSVDPSPCARSSETLSGIPPAAAHAEVAAVHSEALSSGPPPPRLPPPECGERRPEAGPNVFTPTTRPSTSDSGPPRKAGNRAGIGAHSPFDRPAAEAHVAARCDADHPTLAWMPCRSACQTPAPARRHAAAPRRSRPALRAPRRGARAPDRARDRGRRRCPGPRCDPASITRMPSSRSRGVVRGEH